MSVTNVTELNDLVARVKKAQLEFANFSQEKVVSLSPWVYPAVRNQNPLPPFLGKASSLLCVSASLPLTLSDEEETLWVISPSLFLSVSQERLFKFIINFKPLPNNKIH